MRKGAKYPQERDLQHYIGFHATYPDALRGILKDGFLRPKPWEQGGAGTHGVYCLAAIQYNDMSDADQAVLNSRTLARTISLGRNVSQLVLEITFQGMHTRLNQGGIEREAATVWPGKPVHMRSGRESRWVVHEEDAQLVAIWLTGEPPRQMESLAVAPWLQSIRG